MKVVVKPNESLEAALERFNKKVSKSGIIREYKDRRYHKKKSEIRNEKNRKRLHSQRKSKK